MLRPGRPNQPSLSVLASSPLDMVQAAPKFTAIVPGVKTRSECRDRGRAMRNWAAAPGSCLTALRPVLTACSRCRDVGRSAFQTHMRPKHLLRGWLPGSSFISRGRA